MYLTAQHVCSPVSRREGINVFLYLHGEAVPPSSTLEDNPGSLIATSISLPPGGNGVRSFLDILVPDPASWQEVRVGLMDFVSRAQATALPWEGSSERCFFRLGMDLGLAQHWQKELATLYRAAQALRLANLGAEYPVLPPAAAGLPQR